MSVGSGPAEPAVAEVAIIPPLPGHGTFSYLVPDLVASRLEEGMRVLVPLGRRRVTGIVVRRSREAPNRPLKPILDLLDPEPLLSRDLLELCRFAATYYLASIAEVLGTAVFAGLRVESRRTARLIGAVDDAVAGRVERDILRRLAAGRPLRISSLSRVIRASSFYSSLHALAERGLVAIEEEPPRASASTQYDRVFRLRRDPTPEEVQAITRRAPARRHLLARLADAGQGGLSASELGSHLRGAALRALIDRGLVAVERREVYRTVTDRDPPPEVRHVPTPSQRQAIDAVIEASSRRRFEVLLLRGVTGSGKTEVYLQAAEHVARSGRGVLLLVPEIALTHALVESVCGRFGSAVALLHSSLTPGERWDEWRRLARREARLAIGVRSAVFAPVGDLGLVIVDEEHDGAYKQDEGLRYHARDLAIVRARNASCPALLGSATPSVESHHATSTGRYRLLELAERVERRPLPVVELVDLRAERPTESSRIFAPRVADALAENLAGGGQSLVFLNRRGYAHYLQCSHCGHVMGCPNCSVTLTFHLRSRLVRCHHCDHRVAAPDLCPECGAPSLRDFGIGTEQVELVLRELVPAARVARLDRDTIARKGALRRLLEDWRERRIDVLVGTQMVTKGHDVPGVTLVVVVTADQALNFPDFRAAERTFQMLTQVAGRAGRGEQPGRVLIQTYRPNHYALQAAAKNDFLEFAEREVGIRRTLAYPPFSRLANLRIDGIDAAPVERSARELAMGLRAANARLPHARRAVVLGPAPAPIERLRGRHRWQILVKAADPTSLRSTVHPVIEASGTARAVRIGVDVDPQNML